MRHIILYTLIIGLMLNACVGKNKQIQPHAPTATKPTYSAQRARTAIIIDGQLDEWQQVPAIALGYRHLPKEDLAVQAFLRWDSASLYLACKTTDDVFNQPYSANDLWRGDSVHLGFDPLAGLQAGGHAKDDIELVLALTQDQATTWCRRGPHQGVLENIQLEINATGDKGDLVYEAAIPWSALAPLHPDSMRTSGFTLSVNDNDAQAWEGFSYITFSENNAGGLWKGHVQWASGFFPKWDTTQFGTLVFDGSTADPLGPPMPVESAATPPQNLQSECCTASNFSVEGQLLAAEKTFVGKVSLTVRNESAENLPKPCLNFDLYPDIAIERVTDSRQRTLRFVGPGAFNDQPTLATVCLEDTLPPGGTQRLTFSYRGVFAGRVSNHIEAHNSWLLQESHWFPRLAAAYRRQQNSKNRGPITVKLSVPAGQQAVFTAADWRTAQQRSPENIYTWRADEPMVGFSAATYEQVTAAVDGVPVTAWVYPEHREGVQAVVETAGEIFKFYQRLLGPAPQQEIALAETDRRGGYGTIPLLLNSRNFAQEPNVHLIAHELAHWWWRRLGTGLYNLHEGLAEYTAALAMEALYGKALPLKQWTEKYRSALGRDRPLAEETADLGGLYRAVVYNKGPYVLHMLRHTIDEEPFFAALQALYARTCAAMDPVSLDDFEQLVAEESPKEPSWFFDQWLRQVVIPDYALSQVEVQPGEMGFITTLVVRNEGSGQMPAPVVLATENQTYTQQITLADGEETLLTFSSIEEPIRLEIDPQKQILQSWHYNDRHDFAHLEEELAQPIAPEALKTIGQVKAKKSHRKIIRQLVESYQNPRFTPAVAADLWDYKGLMRYFSGSEDGAEKMEGSHREAAEVAGQIPLDVQQGEMEIMLGERSGRMISEVRIPLIKLLNGKTYRRRVLYLLTKANNQSWRFINFDITMD